MRCRRAGCGRGLAARRLRRVARRRRRRHAGRGSRFRLRRQRRRTVGVAQGERSAHQPAPDACIRREEPLLRQQPRTPPAIGVPLLERELHPPTGNPPRREPHLHTAARRRLHPVANGRVHRRRQRHGPIAARQHDRRTHQPAPKRSPRWKEPLPRQQPLPPTTVRRQLLNPKLHPPISHPPGHDPQFDRLAVLNILGFDHSRDRTDTQRHSH